MSLRLYFHPLASFCHKVLIALYENGTPFEPIVVDLLDERSSAAFRAVWPMAKMPVLRDEARPYFSLFPMETKPEIARSGATASP